MARNYIESSRCRETFGGRNKLNKYLKRHEWEAWRYSIIGTCMVKTFQNIYPLQAHDDDVMDLYTNRLNYTEITEY